MISLAVSCAMLLAPGLMAPGLMASANADDPITEGPTIVADSNSPTGYTVEFVYYNPNATQVQLTGDLGLLDISNSGTSPVYQPEEWQTGRYHAGVVGVLRNLVKDDDGYWRTSMPMHAGGLTYWYLVWDPTQGWESKRIWDPASTNPRPPAGTTFRERNNDVLDTVYVPYSEKMNDPALEARATYELPIADPALRGSVEYVEYTTILGDDGHYLGVYLPPGYDPYRAEPYKVAYMAHGIFGDETDFMIPIKAPNILDNMTARGEIEPTVVVTMGNHFTGTGLNFGSYNQQNAANNLVQTILPFVEERYNVSTEASGRAYGGFSYGGMSATYIFRDYAATFGYYGFFSGNPSLTANDYTSIAAQVGSNDLSVFLGRGNFEGNLSQCDAIAAQFTALGYHAGTSHVIGAHDGATAGELFTVFAKDYLWQNESAPGVKNVSALTEMGLYGQRVMGAIVEFDDIVDADALAIEDFSVLDTNCHYGLDQAPCLNNLVNRAIVDVYTVADPVDLLGQDRPAAQGKYVVLKLEEGLIGGWTTRTIPGNTSYVMINPDQATQVVLNADVYSTSGQVLAQASDVAYGLTAPAVNRDVDQFVSGLVTDPVAGQPLHYDYRLPDNYDPAKKYPLVVYLTGMGQGYAGDQTPNRRVHITSDGSAEWWFQDPEGLDEDVIVLAPQNQRTGAASEGAQTAELIENFSKQFSVDTQRVYAYSVSYGSTLLWWLMANRPDLLAGVLLTGGFPNNAAQAQAIADAELPLWVTHSQGDTLLRPNNALASYQRIVAAYEAKGLSADEINEVLRWTLYQDSAFEPFGSPERIVPHLTAAPTLQDPAILQWLMAQKKAPVQGATVVEDPNSPTGYTVNFVYYNPEATSVRLDGALTLQDLATGNTRYQPEQWQVGRYLTGGAGIDRAMVMDDDGYWTASMPLHAGGQTYWYVVTDPSQGWVSKHIFDPGMDKPLPPPGVSFRERNNDVFDSVFVPYAEIQNDPLLETRAAYEGPTADPAQKGTVQYVEYTTILGDAGHYLGVYLPAGYDPARAEPYKVVYLAHGIFGDETDFMIPIRVPDILDNMTARGEIEPTVVVTMGNHFTGTGLSFASYNQQNAADNLVQTILPFVEDNYNVSTEASGRAYGGFSYGGMTGTFVLRNYASNFGYYAFLSGNPSLTTADYNNIANTIDPNDLSVFLGRGNFEGNLDAINVIANNFSSRGFQAGTSLAIGAHDPGTTMQLFTTFAKDYLWQQEPVEPREVGPTIVEDPESPTGYTATFTYYNPDATQVQLAGDLTLLDVNTGTTRYQPEDWQTGRYHAGGVQFTRDMVKDADGYWQVTIPMHAGGLSYWYLVWDPTQGWQSKRIFDPASDKPRPPAGVSFRERNNDVLDAVYVPYSDTMNDPTLQERATYELPQADPAKRGSVDYIEYTTILGDAGHYLGVYLPAGYDPDRAEPYPVAYMSHGAFGDETDFMVPGNTPNILDNMTALGEVEPMVVVTMGNHFTGTSLGMGSFNQQNAANNLVQTILPLIEDRYNVSTEASGRAYGGFSMGGMTGTYVMRNYASQFGYFAFLSGNPSLTTADYDNIANTINPNSLSVFLGRGNFEGNLNACNTIAENFRSRGFNAGTAHTIGAHDMTTAGRLFATFARDYLWQNPPAGVVSMSALTDMSLWGQQVTGVILEMSDIVDADALSVDDFIVRDTSYNFRFDNLNQTLNALVDQPIADVFTVADPALLLEQDRPAAAGKYVVILLEPNYNGWTTRTVPDNTSYVTVNKDQPTQVVLTADILSASGSVLAQASDDALTLTGEPINRDVDQFVHGLLAEPVAGAPLHYDYRLPANYDPTKKYPLVVYLTGMGQGYAGTYDNIGVQITTEGTSQMWFKGNNEDVIVLAPQPLRTGVSVANQAAQTVELIDLFSQEFSVDTKRVYAYSISYGSQLLWWMMANHPNQLAGVLLAGGFGNNASQAAAIAAAELPVWMTHGISDPLLRVGNARASYQRIVDAYKANGLSDPEIAELIKWTEYPDEVFEQLGGPTRIDPHVAAVPTLQDQAIVSWLLGLTKQIKPVVESVSVSGVKQSGQTLTAVASVTPAEAELAYTWYRNGVVIPGATGQTYLLTTLDLCADIRVAVTATHDAKSTTVMSEGGLQKVGSFTDMGAIVEGYAEVCWMAQEGIATGTIQSNGTATFAPNTPLTRQVLAAWLYQVAGAPDHTPVTTTGFADLGAASSFHTAADWLVSNDILTVGTRLSQTTGNTLYVFEPGKPVTRSELAHAFYKLGQIYGGVEDYPVPGSAVFTDVPTTHLHHEGVSWSAHVGVVKGSSGVYNPGNQASRLAFALMAHRYVHAETLSPWNNNG